MPSNAYSIIIPTSLVYVHVPMAIAALRPLATLLAHPPLHFARRHCQCPAAMLVYRLLLALLVTAEYSAIFSRPNFFKRICNSSRLIFYNAEQMWTISIRRDSAACIAYRYASSPMTDYDRLLRYRLCKRIRTSTEVLTCPWTAVYASAW